MSSTISISVFKPILASISILIVLLSIFYSFSQFLSMPFYEIDQLPPTFLPQPKRKTHTSLFIVSILIIFQKNYISKQWGKMKRDCLVLYTKLTIKQYIYIPTPEATFLLIIPNTAIGQGQKLCFYSQTQLQIPPKAVFSKRSFRTYLQKCVNTLLIHTFWFFFSILIPTFLFHHF